MNEYRQADLKGRSHFSLDFDKYYLTAGTEDDYDEVDVYATAKTYPYRTYAIEIKDYTNGNHIRNYSKYICNNIDYGYQIDYNKIDYLMDKWKYENRIPIIYARFHDWTIIWDIRKIPYEQRKKQVWTNKDGQHYGQQKELTWQTYLYFDEAIWTKTTVN